MLHTQEITTSIPNRFEQRDSFRVSSPVLKVEINGQSFRTKNWSLNGLLLEGLPSEACLDHGVTGIFGPDGSAEMCQFSGRIVRIDLKQEQFAIELDGSSREVAALLPLWVLKYNRD
ncbi:hypothetical protein [Sneathiella chinensis]|uniref:PilZ domain-containing protein n=1 Tax=Sneathiella chinensis TaxID=349750 RepID=A0ABQ5U4J5_9PROT|nr:hypothetical protein [Sneathiella chinensis]GLQ06824.1 hypothetical protein GCM10007924_20450 [Sneathiella chinensis]